MSQSARATADIENEAAVVPRPRRPHLSEQSVQRAVFQHIHARGVRGLVAWHTPNGGGRSPIEAKIFKGIGVRAGIPDVLALHQGQLYALELKTNGGRLTPTQAEMLAAMERAGATVAHAVGLDAALAQLEGWGLLRGRIN